MIGGEVSLLLYLDCDILIRKPIGGIFERPDLRFMIAGVEDIDAKTQAERMGVDTYINSGVLLFNLPEIRKNWSLNEMIGKVAGMTAHPENLVFGDQDMINVLYKDHIALMQGTYNFQMYQSYCIKHPVITRNITVAHFISSMKPWHDDYCIVFAREYYMYLRKYLTTEQRIDYWRKKPAVVFAAALGYIRRSVWKERV